MLQANNYHDLIGIPHAILVKSKYSFQTILNPIPTIHINRIRGEKPA